MNAFTPRQSPPRSASATVLAKYIRIPPANAARTPLVYASKRNAIEMVAAKGDDDLMSQPQSGEAEHENAQPQESKFQP
jgi:hypothetical protein